MLRPAWLLLPVLLLAACGKGPQTIVVGSKNFSENVFLAELIAQQIERETDYVVGRKFNLGGTFLCHQALISGQIDIYPEYTGTALTAILEQPVVQDAETALAAVRDAYAQKFDAAWMPPFGFDSSYAVLVRNDAPQDLQSLSGLARYAPEMTIGVNFEFLEREDGWRGLIDRYKLRFAQEPKTLDLSLVYQALDAGQIDVAVGNATHGLIPRLNLRILDDDHRYFPPYDAAAVVRQDTLQGAPGLREALKALGGRISLAQMQAINRALDVELRQPDQLAAEVLDGQFSP